MSPALLRGFVRAPATPPAEGGTASDDDAVGESTGPRASAPPGLADAAGQRGAPSPSTPDEDGFKGAAGGRIAETPGIGDPFEPASDAGTAIVLAPGERALLAGAAVASRRGAEAGGVPVVAVWDPAAPEDPGEGTATGRARRGRDRAAACGVEATAAGRTVRVALPVDDGQAVAAIERLETAPGLGPLIVVLAGPWGPPFLGPLERSGTLHADGPAATVAACRSTLARHGIRVVRTPQATGPVARALLRAGWIGRAQVRALRDDAGQAMLLVLLGLTLALVLAGVLGAVATAMGARQERQRAVDVAALAAAARMRATWPERAAVPAGITLARYRSTAVAAARRAAAANGVRDVAVAFPDDGEDAGPLTVRVRAAGTAHVAGVALSTAVAATAEVTPPAPVVPDVEGGDEYRGPLAVRDGKPMRPDVALAYDRMDAAATRAGRPLTVVSGYRSNAEQEQLFRAHPDPKWVARPGTSLHRLGTELDLGPSSAYGWLAQHCAEFGFLKRYSWEPWHFGYTRDTGSTYVAEQGRNPQAPPTTSGAIPPWVPEQYRDMIRGASIRFKVSAALLSAQLKQESGFDPRAVSSAGAQGIAQFMPGTAALVGLRDPFDPAQAIPAQAKLMAGLLRRFGSVQLALAAYNAGEGRVAACRCVPPYPETRHYVAVIVALMRGYDPDGALADVFTIRLVA